MATINWEEAEEKAGGNFKAYAADGKYTVKCDGVEIKEVGQNGSVIMKFHFEDAPEGQYPTADHWLSFKNDNWRYIHNKRLMMLLGASEDAAKKAVEVAESKSGKENVMKGYESCYTKLLAKKPTVEIEVFTEDKYARAEFTDRSVAMPHGDEGQPKESAGVVVSPSSIKDDIENAEEVDLSEIPF